MRSCASYSKGLKVIGVAVTALAVAGLHDRPLLPRSPAASRFFHTICRASTDCTEQDLDKRTRQSLLRSTKPLPPPLHAAPHLRVTEHLAHHTGTLADVFVHDRRGHHLNDRKTKHKTKQ